MKGSFTTTPLKKAVAISVGSVHLLFNFSNSLSDFSHGRLQRSTFLLVYVVSCHLLWSLFFNRTGFHYLATNNDFIM